LYLSECFTKDLVVPNLLTHLTLNGCGVEACDIVKLDSLSSLKELYLDDNPIKDLTGITFPLSLDVLLLAIFRIESLRNDIFPELLVSLDISRNKMQRLRRSQLPQLESSQTFSNMAVIGFQVCSLFE